MTVKVESKGSFWWLDETTNQYLRLPKYEAPREKKEWGTTPGPLQDLIWHPYTSWEIKEDRFGVMCLYITVPDSEHRVRAPYAALT